MGCSTSEGLVSLALRGENRKAYQEDSRSWQALGAGQCKFPCSAIRSDGIESITTFNLSSVEATQVATKT